MSNRKEAIFAMLAAASIGAIWGGPVPFYGARVSYILTSDLYELNRLFNSKTILAQYFLHCLSLKQY